MPSILLAHAEGESSLADSVAGPLQSAGYDVLYEGTVFVGESLIQEASKALGAGSPVVLCGTVASLGTGWAHQVVNAARSYPGVRVFALQMEKSAYLQPLSLDSHVAAYWQDPDKAIRDLLEALREYYPVKAAPGRSSGDHLERRYRDLALRTYDIVDLANLPVTDRHLATRQLLLRSLYVALRIAVEPALGSGDPDDSPSGTGSRQQEISAPEEPPDAARRWAVGERLTCAKRLVVLGDPGAGKSTLLRWIATAYLLRLNADPDWRELPDIAELPDEDWLPILVRCRDLEEPQAAVSLEQILDHHLRKLGITGAEAGQLNELLLSRLSDGRALLLLDGLDEIAQPTARARFCRQVEQVHVAYPSAPIVATSRIVGYREMGLRIGRGFEHATVLDLTAEDKDDFAHRWCALTEPETRRESAENELIRDIHSTDRIERLTGNPMLLTTMALVKKKVGKLPSKRADLYREAVDVLLNWRSDVDELLDPHEAMPQLEYVAYAMCASGVQQLRADEITGLLGRMRSEFPSVRAAQRHDPLEFLQLLERRTGILVQIGRVRHKGQLEPAYEFRHLTFQEYLAGLALVDRRFPARDRERSLADDISPLAAQTSNIAKRRPGEEDDLTVSENWREALRLCVMLCNDDDVDSVLLAIADVREDEQAAVTARPRAVLAFSCLSDEPNVSEDVAVKLIDRFAGVLRPADGPPQRTAAAQAIAEVGASLWGPLLTRRLITAWLSAPPEDALLGSCASRVGGQRAPTGDGELRVWLSQETRKLASTDPIQTISAALSIMQAAFERRNVPGRAKLTMVPGLGLGLMEMLKRPGRECDAAAWAIGWLAMREHSIRDTVWKLSAKQESVLISRIKNPQTSVMTAKFLLWTLAGDCSQDRKLAQTVSAHLSNSDADYRIQLAESYRRLFPTYPDPVISLLGHASVPVRIQAAQLLGQLRDPRAVEPLIAVLVGSDGEVRDTVARVLGELGDPRAVEPLIAVLVGSDGEVRDTVARVLGELGDPRAVEPLIAVLVGSDGEVRDTVARVLGELGDPRAVEPLIAVLVGLDGQIRDTVADVLGALGDPRAVEPLIAVLVGSDGEVRDTVADALGQLGDPRAVQPLIASKQAQELAAPAAVVAALAGLGNDSALQEFQHLMKGPSSDGRRAALWALARRERDEHDRILLSRDADGVAPGIDPEQQIGPAEAERYAHATDLALHEVRRRYERLQRKYLLNLKWNIS